MRMSFELDNTDILSVEAVSTPASVVEAIKKKYVWTQCGRVKYIETTTHRTWVKKEASTSEDHFISLL